MIQFEDVSFGYPQKELFSHVYFTLEPGDHAAFIGSNGTGKSSLLKLLLHSRRYTYDGRITMPENIRIGFVDQFINHVDDDMTAFSYLAEPFVQLQEDADRLCAELETAQDMTAAFDRYQAALDAIDAVDGYNYNSNIKKQLALAELSGLENVSVNKISGGEYKLLTIIRSMMLKPQLLIMDEPDVFLDFENIVGLSRLINDCDCPLLVVTHNRLLLSQCFNKILHLEGGELQAFPGTFAEYSRSLLDTKIMMQEQAAKEAEFIEIQQALVERIREKTELTVSPDLGRQLRARVAYLERWQKRRVKDPFLEDHEYGFSFAEVEEGAEVTVDGWSLDYDRPILSNVCFTVAPGEKVAIVGANGTGKSSLLRLLAESLPEEGISTGYFAQIYDDRRGNLSGGERNLQQLQRLAQRPCRVLLLDEPTSHLDTYAQIALEEALAAYKGTVLMVSHDFYTIAAVADRVLMLENRTVREMSGRAYRKSVYKKYFSSDILEQENARRQTEVRVNALLKAGKTQQARQLLEERDI